MKKAIVLSVLGIAASGMAAFGQGVIAFNNYSCANYNSAQVLWGANTLGNTVGSAVTPTQGVTVQLFYALGDVSGDSSSQFLAAATGGLSGGIAAGANPGGAYGVGPYGYYALGNQIINGWSSGAVTFAVEAWVGSDYASATTKGISALFTSTDAVGSGPGIVASSLPAHYFGNMNSVTLTSSVPEPATLALGGLGLAALMLFRRKQV